MWPDLSRIVFRLDGVPLCCRLLDAYLSEGPICFYALRMLQAVALVGELGLELLLVQLSSRLRQNYDDCAMVLARVHVFT